MTGNGILQIALLFLAVAATARPLGRYLERVYGGERWWGSRVLGSLERLCYRVSGVRADREQTWKEYAASLLGFSLAGALVLYGLQRLQGWLPGNPRGFGGAQATPDLSFNTALSFVTNTNWQNYAGESALSHLVQAAGLTVQNFASAAAGMAVAVALARALARQESKTIGNFWADLVRGTVYVLLPGALAAALFFCSQGVVQNWAGSVRAVTVEGQPQEIAQGPVASQEAIKMLGTNGGGVFNANSAHPYENPTPLSNFAQMFLILVIPGAMTYLFGRMVGDARQGWALFGAMALMLAAGVLVLYGAEQAGVPAVAKLGVAGGNMEGKETRFGVAATSLFAAVTTAASCGAVNGMHDSLTPLGGLVTLFHMQTGEVIFGGVGAGLYGMLLFAMLAVFISGLMVGRTPEYVGKKIEAREVKMAMLALIATSGAILAFSGVSMVAEFARGGYWNGAFGAAAANTNNAGPHGFSEILYAYTSAAANNGSAFAGLSGNTPWYNLTLGLGMLAGRFLMIVPLLAAAGSLAGKKRIPVTAGTLPTHGPLFVGLLVGTVVIVGALTFFPALALGPVVEQILMQQGRVY